MSANETRHGRPGTLTVVRAVSRVTLREVLRDRVLYNIGLCALLLFGVGYLAARLTFIQPARVLIDFGVSAMNLSCAAIAILTGASLIAREFDRRTIHVALAHPISRGQFMLGKYVGLAGVIGLNWLILCAVFYGVLALMVDAPLEVISGTWALGLALLLLQSLLLAAVTLFFASFTSTSLAVVMSIGIYLVGNNISQLRVISASVQPGPGKWVLDAIAAVWPNLEYFHLDTKIVYQLPVTAGFVFGSLAYGLCAIGVFLCLASLLVRFRDV